MLIALDYISNETKYLTMSQTYGGNWTRYSCIVLKKSHKYYHRLCGRSLSYWITQENINKWRKDIFRFVKHNKGCIAIPGLECLIFPYFRTIGFLDCITLDMCKLSSVPLLPNA